MPTGTTLAGWMSSKRVAVFTGLLSLMCLLGEVAYCWRAPKPFFDTLAYVAIAEGGPNDFAVADVECSVQVPGKRGDCDVVGSLAMTHEVEGYSPAEFAQFLRFYTVKPLYVGLADALHRDFRVGSFVGLRMISVSSFLVIGVVSWAWLQEHLPVAVAPIAAFWMTAYGPVLGLGKDLLPDGLSTALLLVGTYLVLYRSKVAGMVVLGLAVLARPDCLLFVACLAGAWVLERSAGRRWMKLGAVVLGCGLVGLALGKATGALGWAVLFRRSFFEMVRPGQFAAAHVSLREYAHVMASNGVRVVMFCLPVGMFLGLLAWVGDSVPPGLKPLAASAVNVRAEARTLQRQSVSELAEARTLQRQSVSELAEARILQGFAVSLRALVLASVVAVILRVLVQPGVEERYYVWFYLVCAIAAASVMAELCGLRGLRGAAVGSSFVQPRARSEEL